MRTPVLLSKMITQSFVERLPLELLSLIIQDSAELPVTTKLLFMSMAAACKVLAVVST